MYFLDHNLEPIHNCVHFSNFLPVLPWQQIMDSDFFNSAYNNTHNKASQKILENK